MSETPAVRLVGVSKMYKVFSTRRGRLVDALGLSPWLGRFRPKHRQFWSLRDIELVLSRGSRLGIIGRNGAGKSTLLKLVTGAIAPSEGEIEVNGRVQAMFEAGTGFHPEFTGLENIRASLTYQGLDEVAIDAAVADIAEFAELGQFLTQPIKTYSSGMLARLAFGTATAVHPDLLIVDEVLGAGDAYFLSKSAERMRRMVDTSGAAVLLVSHATEQILQYCDECIWIERGRIMRRGRALEVVNAYQSFIHDLDDRRLRAKNRQRLAARDVVGGAVTQDAFRAQLEWRGALGSHCAISELRLIKDGVTLEQLLVGDVQDSSNDHLASVVLGGSNWGEPSREDGVFFRSLSAAASEGGIGRAIFRLMGEVEEGDYALAVRYRSEGRGVLVAKVALNDDSLVAHAEAPEWSSEWADWTQPIGHLGAEGAVGSPELGLGATPDAGSKEMFRWASEGSMTITRIRITGSDGSTRAVFRAGEALHLSFDVRANRDGDFNLVAGASLYRVDGIFISNLISAPIPMRVERGQSRRMTVELSPLSLSDGDYVFSLSIFEGEVRSDTRYDLVARCIEFKVTANERDCAGTIFRHPANWRVEAPRDVPA
ncbi:MAG: ABC transporter ATP-binding protein [Deltaproteobacteria bacterium]|nr:ABC transporter ATP-binding protein [Deltaproteobacteria bacterium]